MLHALTIRLGLTEETAATDAQQVQAALTVPWLNELIIITPPVLGYMLEWEAIVTLLRQHRDAKRPPRLEYTLGNILWSNGSSVFGAVGKLYNAKAYQNALTFLHQTAADLAYALRLVRVGTLLDIEPPAGSAWAADGDLFGQFWSPHARRAVETAVSRGTIDHTATALRDVRDQGATLLESQLRVVQAHATSNPAERAELFETAEQIVKGALAILKKRSPMAIHLADHIWPYERRTTTEYTALFRGLAKRGITAQTHGRTTSDWPLLVDDYLDTSCWRLMVYGDAGVDADAAWAIDWSAIRAMPEWYPLAKIIWEAPDAAGLIALCAEMVTRGEPTMNGSTR